MSPQDVLEIGVLPGSYQAEAFVAGGIITLVGPDGSERTADIMLDRDVEKREDGFVTRRLYVEWR